MNDAGYFSLDFGLGFTNEEISTICQVFNDVSSLFSSQQSDIPILIRKQLLAEGVYDAASAYWRSDTPDGGCGVEHNMVWKHINTMEDFSQLIGNPYAAGELRLNSSLGSGLSWHTLDLDANGDFGNPMVGGTFVDLYSVVLHEVMHMLGFYSRITSDGSALNGFYSPWDRQLFGILPDLPNPSASPTNLITPVIDDPGCCDAHEYNTAIGIAPSVLNIGCGSSTENAIFYQYGSAPTNVVTVFGDYAPGQIDDPTLEIINILSHINKNCDNLNYVLHSSFGTGEDRRILISQELDILCNLGYELNGNSTSNFEQICDIVAIDYFFELEGVTDNATFGIINSDYIIGDYDPENPPTVIFTDCDPFHNINIFTPNPFETRITDLMPGSTYSICSTVTSNEVGCNSCDEGMITIFIPLNDNGPTLPDAPECGSEANLLPWGDFEIFDLDGTDGGLNIFFGETNTQVCDPLGTNTGLGSGPHNSPGIVVQGGNQIGYLAGRVSGSEQEFTLNESLYLPLSRPIFPGCTIALSLDLKTDNNFDPGEIGNIQIYGSKDTPCVVANFAGCDAPPLPDGFQCIQSGIVINSPINDFTTYSDNTWTNNSPEPIYYLLIANNASEVYQGTSGQQASILVDNIYITQDCDNELLLSSSLLEACAQDEISIEYEVCLNGSVGGATDIQLSLNLPDVLSPVYGAGDFQSTEYTLPGVMPGTPCQTVSLVLDISNSSLVEGYMLEV